MAVETATNPIDAAARESLAPDVMATRGAGLWTWAHRLGRQLSDLVLPPACVACQTRMVEHDALCPSCWRQIDFILPPLCDRLGLPLPYDTGGVMISAAAVADPPDFDRARSVALYTGPSAISSTT